MSAIGDFMSGSAQDFANFLYQTIQSAFSASDINRNWWASVVGSDIIRVLPGQPDSTIHYVGMLNVLIVVMVPIMVLLVGIQLVQSVFRGSALGVLRAVGALMLSIPLTYVTTGLIYTAIVACDHLALGILNLGQQDEKQSLDGILNLFGMAYNPTTHTVLLDEHYQQWETMKKDGSDAHGIIPFLIAFVILVCALVLAAMMVARLVGLLLLSSFTPIVLMAQTWENAKGLLGKWSSMVIGLLAAKPLAACVIKIGMTISTSTGDKNGASQITQLLAGIVCMLIAALAPAMVNKVTAFMGSGHHGIDDGVAQLGQRGSRHAGQAWRGTKNTARTGMRAARRAFAR